MMYYGNGHMSGWGWFGMTIGMIAFWGLLIALAVLVYRAFTSDSTVGQSSRPAPSPTPPKVNRLKEYLDQIEGYWFRGPQRKFAREAGVSDERLFAVAVWQETPFFSEEERAALALTEAMTRLSEGGDRVPDEVWAQAGKQFDETALAALVMLITTINAWNRIGVSTRMVPRSYIK